MQVGRLDHEIKGHHILIKALKILIYEMNVKNVCVDFIGEGKSKIFLKEIVKKYQLEKFVNFLGKRERVYIYENLKNYNLLIQPSLYEGFGLTIVEAIAAKVPVLVSNIDGPLEIVESPKFGWIFESQDVNNCTKQILNIYNNYQNIAETCSNAYNRVKENYHINITVNSYLANYSK